MAEYPFVDDEHAPALSSPVARLVSVTAMLLDELEMVDLPPSAADADIDFWIARHRRKLEEATGSPIDPRQWQDGFRAALYELMIERLPMYALVNRVRRQPFLPRVVQTWRRLYERFPLEHGT